MITFNTPSWNNSALVLKMFGSVNFSMTSDPLLPVLTGIEGDNVALTDNLADLDIVPKPFGSDIRGYQRFLKFLKVAEPPYRIGTEQIFG